MTEAKPAPRCAPSWASATLNPGSPGRPWQAVPDGWTVAGELQGWRFRLETVPGGVRVIASAAGGEPAVWVVLGRG